MLSINDIYLINTNSFYMYMTVKCKCAQKISIPAQWMVIRNYEGVGDS